MKRIFALTILGTLFWANVARADEAPAWFFDFNFEQYVWNARSAEEAFALIEEDAGIDNRTHEDFYYFTLGVNPTEKFTLYAEIPYIIRNFIEIEDPDFLGRDETSEGWGDLWLVGEYEIWSSDTEALSLTGGVKFPTGKINAGNSRGDENPIWLQPGTGSFDYLAGAAYSRETDDFFFETYADYYFITEGEDDWEYGDFFEATAALYRSFSWQEETVWLYAGAQVTFWREEEEAELGVENADSGGDTLFLGPAFSFEIRERVYLYGNILFPVYQNLGGVAEEIDFSWNAGAKVVW